MIQRLLICATRNTATKNKILKQKELKEGVIQLLEREGYLALLLYKDNTIYKAKAFIKSHEERINRKIVIFAKREFKKWIELYWRDGYLLNDDSQILDKFNVV